MLTFGLFTQFIWWLQSILKVYKIFTQHFALDVYLTCAVVVDIQNPQDDLISFGVLAVAPHGKLLCIVPKCWVMSVAPSVDCVCLLHRKMSVFIAVPSSPTVILQNAGSPSNMPQKVRTLTIWKY